MLYLAVIGLAIITFGILTQPHDIIVIKPQITVLAYSPGGFYGYYSGKCDVSCLSIQIIEPEYDLTSSKFGMMRLSWLGYDSITDIQLHNQLLKDNTYLKRFNKIFVLHNEYVTREIFDALQNHDKVIYLYPNALYAEVTINDGVITLVRGHGYPTPEIDNGFDWEFDNSPMEYDRECKTWLFYEIRNGWMLNCYPDYFFGDKEFLERVRSL